MFFRVQVGNFLISRKCILLSMKIETCCQHKYVAAPGPVEKKKKQAERTQGRALRVTLRANNGIVPPQEDHPRQDEGINEIAASQQ